MASRVTDLTKNGDFLRRRSFGFMNLINKVKDMPWHNLIDPILYSSPWTRVYEEQRLHMCDCCGIEIRVFPWDHHYCICRDCNEHLNDDYRNPFPWDNSKERMINDNDSELFFSDYKGSIVHSKEIRR